MGCGSVQVWSRVRQAWSVDEITMTDARSRVNGGGRNECGRGGAAAFYIFIWNGTTGLWIYPLGVGTSLKPGLATGFRGFQTEYKYTNDCAIIVYSNGAVANPQFALCNSPSRLKCRVRFDREKPLTTTIY